MNVRKRLERLFELWANLLEAIFPDPFTLSLILTLVALLVARVCTPHGLGELVSFWGTGLWDFVGFAMQMALILVTGQALAEAPIVASVLTRLASLPKTMSSGVVLVSVCAMTAAWLNWGFGLVVGALLARQVADCLAERLGEEAVSRALLGAAGYMSLAYWHGGISGSAPLAVAEEGHTLMHIVGVISLWDTVGSAQNLWLSLVLLILVPAFLVLLCRLGLSPKNEPVAEREKPQAEAGAPSTGERILVLVFSVLAVYWWIAFRGLVDLNAVIFAFLFLGLAAHGSASRYARALDRSVSGISGIVLQFPFYAGIVGIATGSGLVKVVSDGFVAASQGIQDATGFQPFLLFVFWSAGLANLFVPSGGGQWMIQGPIVLSAATELKIEPSMALMAVAYGDQWTNLLQPFWALPLLAITGLKPAHLLSVTTLLLLWVGLIISVALCLF